MNTIQENLARLAAIKVVSDALAAEEKKTKSALAEGGVGPGDRVHARIGDASAGTVTMTQPAETFKVRDAEAFTKWVQKNHPDEIVPSVRSSFQAFILKRCATTGEMPDGVEPSIGTPYITVRLTDEQRAVMTEALRSPGFDWRGLLAIEAGE